MLPAASPTVTAAAESVAPATTPRTLVNPVIDASNPAVAAAIAAYHVVDGIFDSSKPARVKVVVASVMQPTVEYGHHPNASL
jgi:hypothetical protein